MSDRDYAAIADSEDDGEKFMRGDVGGVSLSPAPSDEDSYRLGLDSLARWEDLDSWREPDPEQWDWQEL